MLISTIALKRAKPGWISLARQHHHAHQRGGRKHAKLAQNSVPMDLDGVFAAIEGQGNLHGEIAEISSATLLSAGVRLDSKPPTLDALAIWQ